jgi:hypothetical protein
LRLVGTGAHVVHARPLHDLAEAEAQDQVLFQVEHQVEARQPVVVSGTAVHRYHGTLARPACGAARIVPGKAVGALV